jgi:hypothetical protein
MWRITLISYSSAQELLLWVKKDNFVKNIFFIILEFGEYQWKTYKEVYLESLALSKYLMKYNMCPKTTNEYDGTHRFISIYSKNR